MNRTILITGGSTGLGADMAVDLAKGNRIVIHYCSSADAAKGVSEQVQAAGGTPYLVQADLTNENGAATIANFVQDNLDSKLDVLINNAGALIRRQTVEELSWDLMQECFTLNVFSLMRLTSLCVPFLRKGTDPQIINLTSIAMRHGAPTATIYGASKGAVDSFTRGCAKELAPDIRVNAIAPGVIETPFHEKVSTPEQLVKFAGMSALQRNGKAAHITSVVRLLIENDFITGETIDVNGGLLMR